jgi:2-polyprenyl-3-methyl-5-hydroxy-6-metoxy-1,4-benzoquinol methylase
MRSRLENEIKHGKFLAEQGAGEIWNWETPAGKKRWKRRVDMLTSHILPAMSVLELGCGTGYFTKELVKTGGRITAIDISDDLLSLAKQAVRSGNCEFRIENAYDMNFSDGSFDSVVGSSVLHHLELDDALSECYRVLKPGGSMYFTEPNMLNPQIALQKNILYLKKKLGDSPDETAFFRWKLQHSLIRHGFTNISIIPFDWLHPATPIYLIRFVNSLGEFLERTPVLKEFAGSLYIRSWKPVNTER